MNYLLLSGQGEGLGLALKLRFEGNDVVTWIRESHAKRNYEGLIHKTKGWEKFLGDDTVVLFDSIGGGKTAERLRAEGHNVIGGGLFSDQLEFDLESTYAELEVAGLAVVRKYALSPTYGVEAWFDGTRFLDFTVWYLRRTRLMPGDLGPRTPCSGTLVWVENVLHPHFEHLAKLFAYHKYKGPVSLTLDGDDSVIDMVARFTWDTLPAMLEVLKTPLGDLLTFKSFGFSQDIGVAIRVSQPGYGYSNRSREGQIISGLERADREHFYLYSVALDDDNQLVTTGYRGALLAATGVGPNVAMAVAQAERIAEKAQVTDKQFRIGLGPEFIDDYNTLTGGQGETTDSDVAATAAAE